MSRTGEGSYATAESRWAGVGPYYAMFPVEFADRVVRRYTAPGDIVLDPFAGRGTAIFSAATQKRVGIGIEVNPVGWVYMRAKLHPAPEAEVADRIEQISRRASRFRGAAAQLPIFFQHCFTPQVAEFLLAARAMLDWRRSNVDTTTTAFLLIYLHGKHDASLSNQMRQTKAMAPDYSVTWWKRHRKKPPEVDPVEFFAKRIRWRYAKGRPNCNGSKVYLGDSRTCLPGLAQQHREQARLLFTSPPYCGVTNYHYDQWLRLWLLGGASLPQPALGHCRGRFCSSERYETLLTTVFTNAAPMMSDDATIYVRTDRREVTLTATKKALAAAFPTKRLSAVAQPFRNPTQTRLFGDNRKKDGEIDLILKPR
jgi:hypothetical protein